MRHVFVTIALLLISAELSVVQGQNRITNRIRNTDGIAVGAASCEPKVALERYLLAKESKPSRVVALDHDTGVWEAWTWDGKTLGDIPKGAFEIPPGNDPILLVDRGGRAAIYLINTNPLLYASKQGAVTVTDIAAIEDLKKVLSLMGGFVSSAVQFRANMVTASSLRTMTLARDRAPLRKFQAATQLDPLSEAITTVINTLEPQKEPLAKATEEVVNAAKRLTSALTQVATDRDVIGEQLQLIENEPKRLSVSTLKSVQTKTDQLMGKQKDLTDAVANAVAVPATCPETVAALRQAIIWKIDGVRPTQLATESHQEAWDEIIATLLSAPQKCDMAGREIQEIGRWLSQNEPQSVPADAPTQELFAKIFRTSDDFVSIVNKRSGAVAKANEATAKRATSLKETVQVSNFVTLRDDYLKGISDDAAHCLLVRGVVPVQELEYDKLQIGPTKVRNEEFTVTVRPAFGGSVERQLSDQSGKFHLKKSDFDVDFDTGLAYTRLYESTYAAVKTNPNDANFTIQESTRKTRAGQVALFVTVRPPQGRARGLGLQLGFGLDTANPSLYTGIAWRLGDYAKISVGETFQRVTKLANGQFVGRADLGTAEELATRDGWTSKPYIALSLTLDNLPIFSGGQ